MENILTKTGGAGGAGSLSRPNPGEGGRGAIAVTVGRGPMESKTIAGMRTPVLISVAGVFNDAGSPLLGRGRASRRGVRDGGGGADGAHGDGLGGLGREEAERARRRCLRSPGGRAHGAVQRMQLCRRNAGVLRVGEARVRRGDRLSVASRRARGHDPGQPDEFAKHPDADERHSFVELEVTYGETKEEVTGKVRIELYEELPQRVRQLQGAVRGEGRGGLRGSRSTGSCQVGTCRVVTSSAGTATKARRPWGRKVRTRSPTSASR